MLPTELSVSIHNPMLIYSLLALYGVLTVLVLTYVHSKFRLATKTLKALDTEWQSDRFMVKGPGGEVSDCHLDGRCWVKVMDGAQFYAFAPAAVEQVKQAAADPAAFAEKYPRGRDRSRSGHGPAGEVKSAGTVYSYLSADFGRTLVRLV